MSPGNNMSDVVVLPTDDVVAAADAAAEKIDAGLPVGLPTDTVYVLAGDPEDPGTTDRMFALKQRPRSFDLSVLVASPDDALELATAVPPLAKRLMDEFWPGPLTLVLPQNPELPLDLGDDDATIGVRMPNHPVALAVLERTGALAATPAGVQGETVYETADEVAAAFGRWVPLVLDAGRCAGMAATVVDVTGPDARLLREGPVLWSDIEAVLG